MFKTDYLRTFQCSLKPLLPVQRQKGKSYALLVRLKSVNLGMYSFTVAIIYFSGT